mgnify:FL=1
MLGLILISCSFVGCTNSSGSSPLVDSITDVVKDIINPDPSLKTVEKKISEIKNELNKNAAYVLTEEDVDFLKTQSHLNSENEIKAWVK